MPLNKTLPAACEDGAVLAVNDCRHGSKPRRQCALTQSGPAVSVKDVRLLTPEQFRELHDESWIVACSAPIHLMQRDIPAQKLLETNRWPATANAWGEPQAVQTVYNLDDARLCSAETQLKDQMQDARRSPDARDVCASSQGTDSAREESGTVSRRISLFASCFNAGNCRRRNSAARPRRETPSRTAMIRRVCCVQRNLYGSSPRMKSNVPSCLSNAYLIAWPTSSVPTLSFSN